MVSRWPVASTVTVQPHELDSAGRLTDAGAQRVFAHARQTYFDECTTLDGVEITAGRADVRIGDGVVAGVVEVLVGVVEIYPDSFTMRARIRPQEGEGIAADCESLLSVAGELPPACDDEFIARAHDARHMG